MQTVYVQNTSFHTQIQMTDINQKVVTIGNLPLNLLQPVNIHFLDQGARNLVEYYFQTVLEVGRYTTVCITVTSTGRLKAYQHFSRGGEGKWEWFRYGAGMAMKTIPELPVSHFDPCSSRSHIIYF